MASYEYRILIGDDVTGAGDETSAASIALTRAALADCPAGTTAKIERRIAAESYPCGCAPQWMAHRAYIVGTDGIVRRTDRTSTAQASTGSRAVCKCAEPAPGIAPRCRKCGHPIH